MFCILYLCHKNNIQFFPESFEHPSIHLPLFFHVSVTVGLDPSCSRVKARSQVPVCDTREPFTLTVRLLFPINLVCMSLGYGRKPEHPGRTHASFSLPASRFKSRTVRQQCWLHCLQFKDHLWTVVAAVSFKMMSSFISFSSLPDRLTKTTRRL